MNNNNAEYGLNILLGVVLVSGVLYLLWELFFALLVMFVVFAIFYGVCWTIGYLAHKIQNHLDKRA